MMEKILKSKIFWLALILAAAVVFLVGINLDRNFKAEVDVLILPKSDSAVRNISQIMGNAKEIPRSLSFYDKLLERNEDIEDEAAGLPDYKRKAVWNSKNKIEQIGSSGIVKIEVFDPSQWQAEILSRQVATDVAVVMSKYYNVKTDLDVRIIDGPIIGYAPRRSIAAWIGISLLVGLAAGFLLSLISSVLSKAEIKRKFQVRFPFRERKPFVISEEKAGIPKGVFEAEKKEEPAFVITKKEKPVIGATKKAAAPSNLPVGEEFIFEAPKIKPEEEKPEEKKTAYREATPEEVKERLNKLLRGEM